MMLIRSFVGFNIVVVGMFEKLQMLVWGFIYKFSWKNIDIYDLHKWLIRKKKLTVSLAKVLLRGQLSLHRHLDWSLLVEHTVLGDVQHLPNLHLCNFHRLILKLSHRPIRFSMNLPKHLAEKRTKKNNKLHYHSILKK